MNCILKVVKKDHLSYSSIFLTICPILIGQVLKLALLSLLSPFQNLASQTEPYRLWNFLKRPTFDASTPNFAIFFRPKYWTKKKILLPSMY